MTFSLSGLNKSVQESGVFQKAKSLIWEEGLSSNAKAAALSNLEAKTSSISNDIGLNIKKMSDAEKKTSNGIKNTISDIAKESYSTPDGMKSLSPWKDAKGTTMKSVSDYAQEKTYASYHLNDQVGNVGTYIGEYKGAVNAAKRDLNTSRAINTVKGYYANPISDGRYGDAVTRIGLTGAGAIGAGSLIANAFSDPDSSNY